MGPEGDPEGWGPKPEKVARKVGSPKGRGPEGLGARGGPRRVGGQTRKSGKKKSGPRRVGAPKGGGPRGTLKGGGPKPEKVARKSGVPEG